MSPWTRLEQAVRAAGSAGQPVAIWWRDDDAVAPTAALDRLLSLSARHRVPLALAAIPAGAQRSLAAHLGGRDVEVLVHGLSHANHEPDGTKTAEFGAGRPPAAALADAAEGLRRLKALVPAALPVLVPPWNRIAPAVAAGLAAAGYRGLSASGDGPAPPGLLRRDIHADPIDWRGTRSAVAAGDLVERTLAALARRGDGSVEPAAPIGLLSHHLVHDEAVWNACDSWLSAMLAGGARPVSARMLFQG